ncbi:hypothetical protein [Paenibacillus sp. KS-LC4]|uniref:hypothetical protein n=1 Tax=Paenibacillus sp. KS-LC4 TaxID=2979727 RepID=UPI0030CD567B
MKWLRLLVFCVVIIMITIIFLMYDKFERNILIFKIATHFIGCYLLFFELFFVMWKAIKSKLVKLKKVLFIGMCIYGFWLGLLSAIQFSNLFVDSFIMGYQSKEIVILSREKIYNDSDRILVEMNKERKVFSLAPGYVQVEQNSKYLVHVFEKSKIVIPIEGPK